MPRIKASRCNPKAFLVLVLYIQGLTTVKSATFIDDDNETNSRRAKGLAICEAARTLRETSLKLNRVEPRAWRRNSRTLRILHYLQPSWQLASPHLQQRCSYKCSNIILAQKWAIAENTATLSLATPVIPTLPNGPPIALTNTRDAEDREDSWRARNDS
jgi:hypothetical protein